MKHYEDLELNLDRYWHLNFDKGIRKMKAFSIHGVDKTQYIPTEEN